MFELVLVEPHLAHGRGLISGSFISAFFHRLHVTPDAIKASKSLPTSI